MPESSPRFRRLVVKLSGEALLGDQPYGIDASMLKVVASELSDIHKLGVEIGICMGGGNIFRGLQSGAYGMGRVAGDHVGMLATVINSVALGEVLQGLQVQTRIMSAIDMNGIAEPYTPRRAIEHLGKKRVLLLAAGTGNPFFSTDTAAALRALETEAQVLLKATKVDGVYDRDPETQPGAVAFPRLTYHEILERNLGVMDLTAVTLAMEQNLPILVFNLKKRGNIRRVVLGERVGTLITRGES